MANKNLLIVFYSLTGNTKKIAFDLASKLDADLEEVLDYKKRTGILGFLIAGKDAVTKQETKISEIKHNPENYKIILIGTPVWGWSITPAIRTFINKYKNNFRSVGFFVTSKGAKTERIVNTLEEISQKKSIVSVGFLSKEIKNQEIYNKKIEEFVSTFKK